MRCGVGGRVAVCGLIAFVSAKVTSGSKSAVQSSDREKVIWAVTTALDSTAVCADSSALHVACNTVGVS
jgi:hypothetical protein